MNHEAIMQRVRARQTVGFNGAEPSLRQIARTLEIPPSTFTRIQNGKNMSAEALLKIIVWIRDGSDESIDSIIANIVRKPKKARNGRS